MPIRQDLTDSRITGSRHQLLNGAVMDVLLQIESGELMRFEKGTILSNYFTDQIGMDQGIFRGGGNLGHVPPPLGAEGALPGHRPRW